MVHADKSPSATTSRSPARQAQEEFLLRDFSYHHNNGEDAVAAYRAGLSSAAAICDLLASQYKVLTQASDAMKLCGDAISDFRDKLHWSGDRSIDSESDAARLNQITSSESNSDA